MDVVDALRNRIVGSQDVRTLISEHVYQNRVPKAAGDPKKYVILQRVSTNPDTHLEGASGLERATVQVSCFALGLDAAKAIRDAVIAAAIGSNTSVQVDGQPFFQAHVSDVREFYEDDTEYHNLQFDVVIWFRSS